MKLRVLHCERRVMRTMDPLYALECTQNFAANKGFGVRKYLKRGTKRINNGFNVLVRSHESIWSEPSGKIDSLQLNFSIIINSAIAALKFIHL
ncbi:hypothetical protein DFP97_116110 [Paenibacillus prosopidis]|uniref:Uncharacterized protein n=1 Tax=Paenibacillus prosopidis TaxID=630520 RepID=A0A368VLY5_9BACL|nr:hypothetical protein DFP97_116110 [Paenibacillus prosopidis]